jgi:hypothetical protein
VGEVLGAWPESGCSRATQVGRVLPRVGVGGYHAEPGSPEDHARALLYGHTAVPARDSGECQKLAARLRGYRAFVIIQERHLGRSSYPLERPCLSGSSLVPHAVSAGSWPRRHSRTGIRSSRPPGTRKRPSRRFLTTDSRRVPGERIAAYAGTAGQFLDAVEVGDGQQPGDPVQAVAAIRRLAAAAEPPPRLQLGSDCVSLVEGKLASVAKELSQWRDLALSTDFRHA